MSSNFPAKRTLALRRFVNAKADTGQGDLFAEPTVAAPAPAPVKRGLSALGKKAQAIPDHEPVFVDNVGDQEEFNPQPDDAPAPAKKAGLAGLSRLGQKATTADDEPNVGQPADPVEKDKSDDDGLVEIKGKVERVLFSNDSFRIYLVKIDGEKVSVATGSPILAGAGDTIVAKGFWDSYKGKKTFKAKLIVPEVPTDVNGVIAWLKSGAVPGVNRLTGVRLGQYLGDAILHHMGDVETLTTALKALKQSEPVRKAEAIANAWNTNAMQPELIVYLGKLGLGESNMSKIIRQYGMAARRIIETNPWQLADTIEGVGFTISDNIGRKSGHKMDSPDRIRAGIRYALKNAVNQDGHCGLPLPRLVAEARRILQVDVKLIENLLQETLDGDELVFDEDTGLASLASINEAERNLVDQLARLMSYNGFDQDRAYEAVRHAESEMGITLDASQRDAAILALTNSVCVITGGPGTGKSTTQKVIVRALKHFGRKIVLGAPTGRAAKRLAEVSGEPASTCHRLLKFDGEIGGFVFDASNRMKENAFVIDEFSMVDIRLGESFIQAIPNGASLTIVGDIDQLPSVGAGQVLRDLIESGMIPTARLTTVHRQGNDSGIVTAAHRINSGQHPNADRREKLNGFSIDPVEGPWKIIKRVVELMATELPALGYDPLKDVQVLAAMRRGDVGIEALNSAIKHALNPVIDDGRSVEIRNRMWTEGDRVMHIKNNHAKGIYNGEVGIVVRCGQRKDEDSGKIELYMKVDYSGYEVTYGAKDIDEVEQCWAATVHKSQGCEYPVVVMVSPNEHHFMLNRNLLYTGVTRAKTECIVVGDHPTIFATVEKSDAVKRFTGLKYYLKAALAPAPEIELEPVYAPTPFIQMD